MQKILLVLLLLVSIPCYAEPDEEVVQAMAKRTNLSPEEIRENYDACDSGASLRMRICGSYHWMVQDVLLNKTYKEVKEKLRKLKEEDPILYSKNIVRALDRAQRSWITYRDAACEFEGQRNSPGGGTDAGLYVVSCLEALTKERINHLESRLSGN